MATILVVDDEEHMLELVKGILESDGYDVITATSGKEGLALLKAEKPDLVMLDMMMPSMSGREVCEEIRKDPANKDVKVVFLTVAQFSEVGKSKLEEMDVQDYITKPFDNADLLERLKKALSSSEENE